MAHQRVAPNRYISDILAKHFPDGYVGHCIDVGASDGVSVNSTYGLEKDRRWTVLSVEPNPEFYPVLVSERVWVEKCACSNFVGKATLHVNVDSPEAFSSIGPVDMTVAAWRKHAVNPETVGEGNIAARPWRDVDVRVETVDALLAKWQFPKLDLICVDVEGTERDVMDGTDLERWKPKVVVLESWEAHGHDAYMRERCYRPVMRFVHNDIFTREA